MTKILFVCSGNTCRSPMAQGIFRKMIQDRHLDVQCESAGLSAAEGMPASENAVAAMLERGIDISDHRSGSVYSLDLSSYDIIVPMTQSHAVYLARLGASAEKLYLFKNGVSDPYGGSLQVYRRTADELEESLSTLADYIEEYRGNSHQEKPGNFSEENKT